MKHIAFKTMAVLMAALAWLPLQAVNTITYTATYDNSALTLGTDTLGGITYSTVTLDGLYNGGAPGTPSLPIDYIRFSVPWNATNFTVSTTTINNPIQPLGYQLYPNQLPQLMSDTIGWSITLPDSSAYQNNVFYPANRAWVVDEGFLAGENHIVTVAVMPVAYLHRLTSNMDQHQYRLSRNVAITLSYNLSDTLAMYPIVRQNTTLRSEGYRLAQRMVVNPENVTTHAPTSVLPMDSLIVINPNGAGDGLNGHDWPSYPIDSTGLYLDSIPVDLVYENYLYPYLIVTTPELKHAVRRIAALKNQKGLRTKVVTIDEVLNSPFSGQGDVVNHVLTYTDDAGKLRQYLRYCYTKLGTEYVLLAGNGVPFRKYASPNYAPCDMYFTDFHSDFHFEITDRHPEIYVGRLLAKSPNQILNYTDKLLRYELNPGHGDPSYLKRSIYTEGLDMIGESRNTRQNFSSFFSDTTIIEVEGSELPKGFDIINEIYSTKYGFMSFHNHGTPSGVALYGIRKNHETYRNEVYGNVVNWIWAIDSVHVFKYSSNNEDIGNALNLMNNKYYPNILYTIACTTMPYDTISHYGSIPMNFGESFTTGKDYGGPAFLGNTREGQIQCSSELEEIFALKIQEGYYKLGMAEALSKETYTINQVNSTHNLLGDPEFEIWTDIPQEFSNINVKRSDNSIIISGIDMDSTIVSVSVCNVNNQVVTKIVTADSVTINDISPNSSIMLCKHNYIPYIAPMFLQNVTLNNSQYVIASDFNAGHSVESTRANGDVIVQRGVEYEIEASGTVTLQDGFKVEKGATFAIYPSSF